MAKRKQSPRPTPPTSAVPGAPTDLRQRLLTDLTTLQVRINADELDEVLGQAERHGWSALEFAGRLLRGAADRRRERSLERRLHGARFRDPHTLETFDWQFNAPTIDRGRSRNWPPAPSCPDTIT